MRAQGVDSRVDHIIRALAVELVLLVIWVLDDHRHPLSGAVEGHLVEYFELLHLRNVIPLSGVVDQMFPVVFVDAHLHVVVPTFFKRKASRLRILHKCLLVRALALVEDLLLPVDLHFFRKTIVTHCHDLEEFNHPLRLAHVRGAPFCASSFQ